MARFQEFRASTTTRQRSKRVFEPAVAVQSAATGGSGIDEAMMIPNVTCEVCHGPGRAHVAAARAGAPESLPALPFGLGQWTAESLLLLYGSCHPYPARAQPGQIRPDDPHLARFQPVGIMQSKCYRARGGALSCVNCHDPHARASADQASYDGACLACHTGGKRSAAPAGSSAPAATAVAPRGAACPVSPQARCVECHMPRVDSGQHVLYTDHWIRVRRPGEFSSMPHAPAVDLDRFDPARP